MVGHTKSNLFQQKLYVAGGKFPLAWREIIWVRFLDSCPRTKHVFFMRSVEPHAPNQVAPSESELVSSLMENQRQFRAFLRKRLRSSAEVDDLLQNALIKALRRRDEIKKSERVVAWFYRILRRTLVDQYRSESARFRRDDAWMRNQATDTRTEKTLCGCLTGLLPKLDPRSAELVRRVDLEGGSVTQVAASLGLKSNAATVALCRARAKLRRALVVFCGECSNGACLDCDCGEGNR